MKQDKNIPQGCKESPLGIIPQEWEVKRLGDIAKIMTGSTPPTSDVANYGTDYLFVSPADLGEKKYIQNAEKKLSEKGFSLSRQFPKGTILFVCIGSTIGKLGIATELLTSNQQINAITCDNVISFNEYVFYSLTQKARKIKLIAGEQAVPIINKSSFENVKIPLPPLPEQQKIAEILTCWDTAIEKQTQLIERLETRKRGLMQQLLTGKKRLKGFEGEWVVKKIKDICAIVKGEQLNKIELEAKGAYPSYSGGITPSGYTDDWNTKENTIIISEGGNSCGYVNFIKTKFWSGGHCYSLQQLDYNINKNFLFQLLKHCELNIMALRVGSGLPNIQKKDLECFKLHIPSLLEQTTIANILSAADEEIAKEKEKLAALKSQKKGLMQVLLTGKKRVKIWR